MPSGMGLLLFFTVDQKRITLSLDTGITQQNAASHGPIHLSTVTNTTVKMPEPSTTTPPCQIYPEELMSKDFAFGVAA